MNGWLGKITKGAVAMPLLVGGIGLIGGLGVALSTSGVASAPGPTISGTYSCATPLGTKKIPATIQDLNTARATLPQGHFSWSSRRWC